MQVDFPLDIDIFDTTAECKLSLHQRLDGVGGSYVLITGRTESNTYAASLLEGVQSPPQKMIALHENTVSNVYAIEREMRPLAPKIIVAIGGGKVADFGKRLAYIANVPLFLVPTIIANDGLISPVAVLQDEGMSVSLPGRMPDTVLIDMQIIGSAPVRYLRAAACDLITNLSATNDWERSTAGETGRMHHLALQMSRMSAHQILDCREWSLDPVVFLRAIVYGQMLSGIAMALAGSSRPCSGSEHLIAHALDALGIGMDTLHGEKVGIASRFCLHLQKSSDPRREEFFDSFGIARALPGCEHKTLAEMQTIFSKTRTMRPGRSTILDTATDAELAERYLAYVAQGKDQAS